MLYIITQYMVHLITVKQFLDYGGLVIQIPAASFATVFVNMVYQRLYNDTLTFKIIYYIIHYCLAAAGTELKVAIGYSNESAAFSIIAEEIKVPVDNEGEGQPFFVQGMMSFVHT